MNGEKKDDFTVYKYKYLGGPLGRTAHSLCVATVEKIKSKKRGTRVLSAANYFNINKRVHFEYRCDIAVFRKRLRGDSNPQPLVPKTNALPLSHLATESIDCVG